MRRIIYFRAAGRDVHIPKLIGSFVIFAALLMFIQSSAIMFESWETAKEVNSCLAEASANLDRVEPGEDIYPECQAIARDYLDIRVHDGQEKLTTRQFWSGLLGPISSLLIWLAVLFVGYILYRTGELVVPIEETIRNVPDLPRRKLRKKKR